MTLILYRLPNFGKLSYRHSTVVPPLDLLLVPDFVVHCTAHPQVSDVTAVRGVEAGSAAIPPAY